MGPGPGGPRGARDAPGEGNGPVWRPGGSLQRGVLSFGTSEFWSPDLGDLEAKNLDSWEDYSMVAKNVLSTAWWPHKGAGGY